MSPTLKILSCFALLLATSWAYKVNYVHGLKITSFDGTIISADAAIPIPEKANETFPILIFPNSWGVPQFEYIQKVLAWGEQGYIMLEYETRGWYGEQGEIDTAGPNDQRDHSAVVDFVLNQTSWYPDKTNIGACGISYGAGISLLAGAHDPRIKTVVSMSGWGNIYEALNGGNSPSLIWDDILLLFGKLVGKIPESLQKMEKELFAGQNMTGIKAFAKVRSPIEVVQYMNARSLPLFVSNNFEDRLFKPNYALDFWQAVTGPKMMLLNEGIHATAELSGLVGIKDNYIWKKVKLWVDYWLKGVQNGVLDEPKLQFQVRSEGSTREVFETWPPSNAVKTELYFEPRGSFELFGKLSTTKKTSSTIDTIGKSDLSGLSAGLPVIGEIFSVYVDVPILADLPLVSRSDAIVFASETVKTTTRLCGTPNVTISVSSNQDKYQVVAYLYKVDVVGIGTLLAHGPWSQWRGQAGRIDTAQISMNTICVNVDEGEYLAVGIALFDALYKPAYSDDDLKVSIHFENPPVVQVPVVSV